MSRDKLLLMMIVIGVLVVAVFDPYLATLDGSPRGEAIWYWGGMVVPGDTQQQSPQPKCKPPTPKVCDGGCCKANEKCCTDVCCKPTDECAGALGVNYCKPTECPEGEYLCKALLAQRCCPNDKQCCSQWGVPFCFDAECPEGTFKCWENDCGKLCCKPGEQCPSNGGRRDCTAVECPPGETICRGRGRFGPDGDYPGKNLCCKQDEICTHHPNGYHRCLRKPPTSQPASQPSTPTGAQEVSGVY
jgi:hypothetical protein